MDDFLKRHEQITRDNEQLRMINQSLTSENKQLLSNLHQLTQRTLQDMSLPVASSSEIKHTSTINEEQFRVGLQEKDRHTSSLVYKETSEENLGCSTSKDTGFDSQASLTEQVELSERLLGEIAYQLERRILTKMFPGRKRFHGFTVSNIPSKIIEASTNPLTGKVDEGYRLYLNQRYENIRDTLHGLGYSIALHPVFAEFIINSYGILKMRPEPGSSQATDFYNPLYLKNVIETTAPYKLQKDLMILLDCLHFLAQMDEQPILLW